MPRTGIPIRNAKMRAAEDLFDGRRLWNACLQFGPGLLGNGGELLQKGVGPLGGCGGSVNADGL